ncbi:RNI-like superfamily protein [Hirschfeldia incana]|nr:RNI-like superfamily protein [Hirschfeldia incana]KAJ0252678.1 RNI-like superfamily protein [Hirschfeldia incana]
MASPAISSQPPEQAQTQTQTESDPKITIQQILDIVNNLHTTVNKSQDAGATIRTAKSADPFLAHVTTPDITPEKVLTTATSLPVPDKKSEGREDHHISKLQRNLRLLKEDVVKLQDLRSEVAEEVWKHIRPLESLLGKVVKVGENSSKTQLTKGMKKDLEVINKKIFNLMCQVPLLPNKPKKHGASDYQDGDKINTGKGIICLHGIHAAEENLKKRAVYRYVLGELEKLGDEEKIYLLSFAVFPENQEVNRTMLMYWWIGEGVLPVVGAESEVKRVLKEFVVKQLIEPVENKRKVEPNCYKMNPFVHSSLVLMAKEIGLFDMYNHKTQPKMNKSKLYKVCLVEDSSSQQEAKAKKMPAVDIETVFNVSERFPDFAFKWFAEDQTSGKKNTFGGLPKPAYKMLKVFYLGRWERTANRHIEVENPELMKYLKFMTKLKLLSFQGISRIERLDDAVCKLRELIILDLRACYNLEKLPDKIDSLKSLIYLDITDCYMIDSMPKRLSWLDNLEVLKGFVVSDADEETVCTLVELRHLKKLRKLTVTINKGGFTVLDLFMAIKDFVKLEKLKVAWGGINKRPDNKVVDGENKDKVLGGSKKQEKKDAGDNTKKQEGLLKRTASKFYTPKEKVPEEPKLPETLRKLDLQCFPDAELPKWLVPEKLNKLEKLYIKGGTELTGFGVLPANPTACSVTVLRLKFLPKLKVEWRDLSKKFFPELNFLEKYQCPQVSLCPTDGIGIWRKAE